MSWIRTVPFVVYVYFLLRITEVKPNVFLRKGALSILGGTFIYPDTDS